MSQQPYTNSLYQQQYHQHHHQQQNVTQQRNPYNNQYSHNNNNHYQQQQHQQQQQQQQQRQNTNYNSFINNNSRPNNQQFNPKLTYNQPPNMNANPKQTKGSIHNNNNNSINSNVSNISNISNDGKGVILGYPIELFLNRQKVKDYQCHLCKNICKNCRNTSCCDDKIFCLDCYNRYGKNKKSCPICKKSLVKPLSKQSFVDSMIARQEILCYANSKIFNNRFKCNWKGKVKDLDNHWKQCNGNPINNKMSNSNNTINNLKQKIITLENQIKSQNNQIKQINNGNTKIINQLKEVCNKCKIDLEKVKNRNKNLEKELEYYRNGNNNNNHFNNIEPQQPQFDSFNSMNTSEVLIPNNNEIIPNNFNNISFT